MKRIVTGVNDRGRSYAVSIDEVDTSRRAPLWDYDPGNPPAWLGAIDPAVALDWVGPQVSGGLQLVLGYFAPAKDIEYVERPGFDKDGFHTTRTIDFVCLLEGELTLILDEERLRLMPGDCVVQQATRHAWLNDGDMPARAIGVLYRPQMGDARTQTRVDESALT
jgi:hypothetical protein